MTTTPRSSRRARDSRRRHRGLRGALSAEIGVVVLVAAVMLARAGIVDHRFPGYVSGHDHSIITAYSGPSMTIAIGLATVAVLLLAAAGIDWWRAWHEQRPGPPRSHDGLG